MTDLLDTRPRDLPRIADIALAALLGGITTMIIAGLSLGLVESYSPPLALLSGLAGAVVVGSIWARYVAPSNPAIPGWWILIVVGGVLMVVAFHTAHHSEHLIVDRDPGVYATTGLWMIDNDSQVVTTDFADFGSPEGLRADTQAYPTRDGGETLLPQFPHGVPLVLSVVGWAFGEKALFIANPILIGLAMMCIFAIGARLAGPLAGTAAAFALGLNPVEAIFGRDTYSEILAQVLIWGGLWMVMRAWGSRAVAPPLVAGLVMGAALTARLDSAVLLPPLALAFTAILLAERYRGDSDAPRSVESVLWTAIGVTAAAMFAIIETRLASPSYYSSLSSRLIELAQATIILAAVGALLVALGPRMARRRTPPASVGRALALVAGAGVAALAAFAWFVRPNVETARLAPDHPALPLLEFLQRRAGRAAPDLDPTESYSEDTMIWLEWYLGPLALAAGALGIALGVAWVLRRGFPRDLTLVLGFVLALSLLYLRDPQITPDQVWAMRRFLPVIIPGVFLAAAGLGAVLISRGGPGRRRAFSAVGLAVLVGVPVWQGIDLSDETLSEYRGLYGGTLQICDAVGDNGAIVIGRPETNLGTYAENIQLGYAPALRAVCDVPTVTTSAPLRPDRVVELAADLRASGRELVIVSPTPEPFGDAPRPVGVRPVMDVLFYRFRLQVESRPASDNPAGRRVRAWATAVPEGAGFVTAFGRGFSRPEPSAAGPRRWVSGPSPRVGILLSRGGETVVSIPMRSFVQPRVVQVVLDGRPVGEPVTVSPDAFADYEVRFDADAGPHTLTLSITPGPQSIREALDFDDERFVSVMVGETISILTQP